MPEERAQRARKDAMRQIKRKQSQLLSSGGSEGGAGGRWRVDVSVATLVVQSLFMLVMGVLVGVGLHVLMKIFFAG